MRWKSGNGHQCIGGLGARAFRASFGVYDHPAVLHLLPHCQEAYEAYYRKRGASGRVYEDLQNVPETLRDVAYYKQMKFVDVEPLYGIDSPANFIRFATDHYGELGLSRLNIFASNKR